MSLINRACLKRVSDGALFYLPPFGLDIKAGEVVQADWQTVPYAQSDSLVETYNRLQGYEITVGGTSLWDDPETGLFWADGLRDFLRDANGYAQSVSLCEWVDTEHALKRVYRNCSVSGEIATDPQGTNRIIKFGFPLRSRTGSRFTTFHDGTLPGEGPYENYLYNGGTTSGSGVIVVYGGYPVRATGIFEGVTDAITDATSAADGTRQLRFKLSTTFAMRIKNIQAIGCGSVSESSSEHTTVVVSNMAWNGSGATSISLNVLGDTGVAAPVSGDIYVAGNAYAYVYITTAGGHQGLQIAIDAERA